MIDLVASVACVHLHPAEWEAPTPRQKPCASCVKLAEKLDLALTIDRAKSIASEHLTGVRP